MSAKSLGKIKTPTTDFQQRQDAFNKELVELQKKYQLKVIGRLQVAPNAIIAVAMLEDTSTSKKQPLNSV